MGNGDKLSLKNTSLFEFWNKKLNISNITDKYFSKQVLEMGYRLLEANNSGWTKQIMSLWKQILANTQGKPSKYLRDWNF